MSTNDVVVAVDQLTKKYNEFTALDHLSFTLERGHILGFIGPNGAGKTTTIKILVGLSRPTSGSATIAGSDCVRDARKIKRLVGFMPDKFGAYDNMRVSEYLDFFGAAFGIGRRQRRKRIDEVMETTGAAYMKDRYVSTLSHGMQQRIGIARTLLHDPEVLIFDEPANGLDPQARIEMRTLLLHLAEIGKTLIVTSHILPELARICDTVAIITAGKLRAFGSLDEILRQVGQRRMIDVLISDQSQLEQTGKILTATLDADAEVTVSVAEHAVRFRTSRTESELAEVLAKLVQEGIAVSQFRELQTDLEEAFLTVTAQGRNEPVDAAEAVAATPGGET